MTHAHDFGSVGDEAGRLLDAVQDWARTAFGEGSSARISTGTAECEWCPLCQLIAVLRGERPEATEKITVVAGSNAPLIEAIPADFAKSFGKQSGTPRVVVEPTRLHIAPQPRPKSDVAAVLAEVKSRNTTNRFFRTQQSTSAVSQKSDTNSWWARSVTSPLEQFLRQHHGRDTATKSDAAGNIGIVSLRLTEPPKIGQMRAMSAAGFSFPRGSSE